MDLTIRQMNPDESDTVRQLVARAFGLPSALGAVLVFPAPKSALVAVLGDRIVGAYVYKIEHLAFKKVGFCSFFVTDPEYHGKGIGKELCQAGVRHLWEEENCDQQLSYVRDDNIASWGAFVKNGFFRTGFPDLVRSYGMINSLRIYISSICAFAFGHDFYVANRTKNTSTFYEKKGGLGQIALYIMVNMLLITPLLQFTDNPTALVQAFGILFAGSVASGYIGTLFSRDRGWRFRMATGGMFSTLTVHLFGGGFFPMTGTWQPAEFERTPRFRRDMAITDMTVWLFLIGLSFTDMSGIAFILLVLRSIPIEALNPFGGGRLLAWNKPLFAIFAIASLLIAFVL